MQSTFVPKNKIKKAWQTCAVWTEPQKLALWSLSLALWDVTRKGFYMKTNDVSCSGWSEAPRNSQIKVASKKPKKTYGSYLFNWKVKSLAITFWILNKPT